MARTLTKKQRGFVNTYAKTGNGTLAAKKNFNVSNDNSAAAVASEVLRSPKVQEALDELGFNEKSAKSVVVEIMKRSGFLIAANICPQSRKHCSDSKRNVSEKSRSFSVDKSQTAEILQPSSTTACAWH